MEGNDKDYGKGPIAYMAKNSIIANLLMILLLAGGIWSMYSIQKEVYPQFQLDIVEVSVTYPGASPAEVEQGILLPVEEAVRGIQGIKEVVSRAEEGSGNVSIELVAGTKRVTAFQEIDQAVARIRTFPDEIEQPEVRLQSRQRSVIEVGLYGDEDIWTLRVLAERLRDQLLNTKNITQVEIGNVPEFVTHVEIPRYRLREYNLTLGQIANVIRQSSEDIPAGAVETGKGEILLRMKERKQWAKEYAQIEILIGSAGAAVKLGDIAKITDGFEETGFHGQFNQRNTVDLTIYRIGDQSPLDIAETVQETMTSFENTLPPSVDWRIDSNTAQDYEDRLTLLTENGVLAIVIVLLILTLFLEYRLAFWVMLGMLISFVGGIFFLPTIGISINMISMFGFLLVLGIVVDDAVVVGENVYEYRQQGMSSIKAAIKGTRDISTPVVFSILTNVIAFIPLLFIPGETGKFWWPLPAVVIVVLLLSLFEALFILPAHLGHAKRKKSNKLVQKLEVVQSAFANQFEIFISKYYHPFLNKCLKFRYITLSIAISVLLIVGGYGYSDHMGIVLMPQVAADEIEAGVRLPVSTTPEQSAKVAHEITESTQRMFEEHNLYEVADGVKTNVRNQNFIDVEIVMKEPDERDMSAQEVIELWRDEIGDIEGVDQISFEAERGPGGYKQDISVDLVHNDIDVLENASKDFMSAMKQYENTRDINDNYDKGKTQFDIKLLPEGRQLGLTPSNVGDQVRNAFYGALAMRQLRGNNEVEVRVKLPHEERKDMRNFENFVVRTPDSTEVPLLDVAEVTEREAFTSINRRNGRRVVTVGMDAQPASAVSQILESLNTKELPALRAKYPGLGWSFEGGQSDMRESTESLYSGFILAMLVIYALLAIAFKNYTQPLIVLFAIPFGIVGAVIGHILLGYDLSLVSLMGVIALSGVVVNDSLIMVDYANHQRGKMSVFEAINEAGTRRFRPIMITTLTTFGGLAPIILETSDQANNLIPMAISLGFGIVFATSIILVIVPCLYMILEDVLGLVKGGEDDN
ncbi:efflux RND transporter permease subunit [Salibacter halophilus]|uniref:Efflux RND transporter permease subunit n=2 Tax=Salibacter halophilus TaxID=1803916 RepID=A0A6N6M9C5_9FLAO|nr:efflux RND transporter permease subunit [Salibacter halophilus]